MRSPAWLICFVVALAATSRAAEPSPYDVIERGYGSHVDRDDPFGFAMKIKSLAADEYKFWRGGKDLFFAWCRANTTDWLADRTSYVPTHGDLHLGNIGSYAAAGEKLGSLTFGMVDFDDAAELPFQLELLQGAVTLKLVAHQLKDPTDGGEDEVIKTMLDAYASALTSNRNATDLLNGDEDVRKLLGATKDDSYEDELKHFTADGKFRRVIRSSDGKVKELLRPANDRRDELAAGIVHALSRDPKVASRFRVRSRDEVRGAIKGVALRTRLGSSGSQGLKKYLVLLDRPLVGVDHDLILYLKQQIPSAAERAGAIARDPRSPGRRCAELAAALTDPPPYLNAWCDVGTKSYWVNVKEPWSAELDAGNVKDAADLRRAAYIWGTVAGAAHGRDGRGTTIASKLTPALRETLDRRAAEYLTRLTSDFARFRADPRVAADIARADAAVSAISSQE